MKKNKQIKNAQEYFDMVNKFAFLADYEFKQVEKKAQEGDFHAVANRLPALISLVNNIGFLRGQDNMFVFVRPKKVSKKQKELYKLEDEFEDRLSQLITGVLNSEYAKVYKSNLKKYYISVRGGSGK
jgi:hypothetical protein